MGLRPTLWAAWRYVFNILVALDQLANALRGGDPDETLSSVCAKRIKAETRDIFWRFLAWFLEAVDPGHLERSIEWDEGMDAIRFLRKSKTYHRSR